MSPCVTFTHKLDAASSGSAPLALTGDHLGAAMRALLAASLMWVLILAAGSAMGQPPAAGRVLLAVPAGVATPTAQALARLPDVQTARLLDAAEVRSRLVAWGLEAPDSLPTVIEVEATGEARLPVLRARLAAEVPAGLLDANPPPADDDLGFRRPAPFVAAGAALALSLLAILTARSAEAETRAAVQSLSALSVPLRAVSALVSRRHGLPLAVGVLLGGLAALPWVWLGGPSGFALAGSPAVASLLVWMLVWARVRRGIGRAI